MSLLDSTRSFWWNGLAVLALAVVVPGCSTKSPSVGQAQPSKAQADPNTTDFLRVSDRLKIDITGTPETIEPIETEIKEDGTISLQFLDRVPAAGKTPGQLEIEIHAALTPRYYAHCNVTVTPTGRWFYVGGEVNPSGSGGRFGYSGPMTVTRAIATAGGFSPFANKRKVLLTRVNGTKITINCHRAATASRGRSAGLSG